MFNRTSIAGKVLIVLLCMCCGRRVADTINRGSSGSDNDTCCVPMFQVRYRVPAEHDLGRTNAVTVYPVDRTGRVRINAIFSGDVHAKMRILEGDYFSDDGGKTWRFEKSAIPEPEPRLLGKHPADARFVYRLVSNASKLPPLIWIERSEDAGQSWTRTKAQVPGLNLSLEHFMLPHEYYHPKDPRVLFVYSRNLPGFYGNPEVVFRSEDGGDSFRVWYTTTGPDARHISVSPVDPRVIYANGDYGSILKSEDAGSSFRLVGMNDTIRMPMILERDKSSGRIDRTGWSRVRQLLAHPHDRNGVFVVTERGVLRSKDGGLTWCALNLGIESGGTIVNIQVDLRDPRTLYVGSYFGLHVSHDDGCSWETIDIYRHVIQ